MVENENSDDGNSTGGTSATGTTTTTGTTTSTKLYNSNNNGNSKYRYSSNSFGSNEKDWEGAKPDFGAVLGLKRIKYRKK